jgi:hypothetical protein
LVDELGFDTFDIGTIAQSEAAARLSNLLQGYQS